MGALLTERYSSFGSKLSEEEVLGLSEQLSIIQSNLHVAAQHCSGGEAVLTKMLAPSTGKSKIITSIYMYQYSTCVCIQVVNCIPISIPPHSHSV